MPRIRTVKPEFWVDEKVVELSPWARLTESPKNQASPNYSVEVNAVDAGLAIVRDWHMPLFYVWPDGGVLTPHLAANRWHRKLDGDGASGSQTAFYLVAKRWAMRVCDVFPEVEKVPTR